jgi:uncharacterized protein (DUF305 family)
MKFRRRSSPAAEVRRDPDVALGGPNDRAYGLAMVMHLKLSVDVCEAASARLASPSLVALAAQLVAADRDAADAIQRQRHTLGSTGIGMGDPRGFSDLASPPIELWMVDGPRPVDRAFVKAMIFHRRGGVAMARRLLQMSDEPDVRDGARALLERFERELRALAARR